MLKYKKAIQSYIYALVLVSLIMSVILTFTLQGIYGKDNINCNKVDFEIVNLCKKDSGVQFNLQNNGEIDFLFKLNDFYNPSEFRVSLNESKKFIYNTKDAIKLKIVPIIKGSETNFECKSYTQTKNIEILGKC